MADSKISALTELTTPDGSEELVINDGGTSKKLTVTNARGYAPAMMEFDGSTGYYIKPSATTSGNLTTVVARFRADAKAGAVQSIIRVPGAAGFARMYLMLRASDDGTVERRNKLLALGWDSSNVNKLNIVSSTSYADGELHTALVSWDADNGLATMVVDGASDINTGAAAHLIDTATLDTGTPSNVSIGADGSGTTVFDGEIGFCGYRDAYLTNWSDFMNGANPKPLDEDAWTEWGAQPLFWNENGQLENNFGSAGSMIKNGLITASKADQKAVLPLFHESAHGSISVQAGAAGEATVDATPRQIAAWNTNGLSAGTTPDHTDDSIQIDVAGTYQVNACLSFSGTASKTYQLELYQYDSTASPLAYAATGFAVDRKLGAGGDVGACSITATINFAAGDKIAVFQSTSDGGSALTVTEAQLSVHRIS